MCGSPGHLQALEQRELVRDQLSLCWGLSGRGDPVDGGAESGFFLGGGIVCVSLFEWIEGLVLSGDACSGSGVQKQPQHDRTGRKTLHHLNEMSKHFKRMNFISSSSCSV